MQNPSRMWKIIGWFFHKICYENSQTKKTSSKHEISKCYGLYILSEKIVFVKRKKRLYEVPITFRRKQNLMNINNFCECLTNTLYWNIYVAVIRYIWCIHVSDMIYNVRFQAYSVYIFRLRLREYILGNITLHSLSATWMTYNIIHFGKVWIISTIFILNSHTTLRGFLICILFACLQFVFMIFV